MSPKTSRAKSSRLSLRASVRISEDDVQAEFKKKNTTFDLTYVDVTANKVAEKIQPTDDELKAYYDQHKTDYNILVPQKRFATSSSIRISPGRRCRSPIRNCRTNTTASNLNSNRRGVKVQQIVLKVAREDLDASVKQKADGLVTKARGSGETTTEAAFARFGKR